MKNFWERYWKWSDKINAPFYKHKERLLLYVALSQTVIVTVGLLNLFKPPQDLHPNLICEAYETFVICKPHGSHRT
jgi:hypothetical protein